MALIMHLLKHDTGKAAVVNFDSERFEPESINWELMKYLRWSRDRYQSWGGIE